MKARYRACKFRLIGFQLILIVLLFVILQTSSAQTLQRLEITQISAPAQGVAVFRDFPDKAAIVIESPITTLRFSSNVEGIVREMHEPDRGRYVLIIEPYTQILVIDAPGFIQQRQRIGNPQAREVRYFEIKPEETTSNLISVIFNVTPPDAKLFVDGQETAVNQTVQIAPGSAEVRLEREGYRTVTDVIEVNERNISFTYNLNQVQQQLVRIRTMPPNADIRLDNIREETSDGQGVFEQFRFPGMYQLQIIADGYLPIQTVIEVTEGGTNEFSYTLERNLGTLRLAVNPSTATIRVNRQEQRLVNGAIELPPGMHSLEISQDRHDAYSENIQIQRGQTLTRSVTLTPHTGTLQLIVSPSTARVRVLDQQNREVRQWTGSQSQSGLLVGFYTLEISSDGYNTQRQSLEIKKDYQQAVNVRLEQLRFTNLIISTNVSDAPGRLEQNGRTIRDFTGDTIITNLPLGNYELVFPSHSYYLSTNRNLRLTDAQHTINVKRRGWKDRSYLNVFSLGYTTNSGLTSRLFELRGDYYWFSLATAYLLDDDTPEDNNKDDFTSYMTFFNFGFYYPLITHSSQNDACIFCANLGLELGVSPRSLVTRKGFPDDNERLYFNTFFINLTLETGLFFSVKLGYYFNRVNTFSSNQLYPWERNKKIGIPQGLTFSISLGLSVLGDRLEEKLGTL